MRFPVKSLVCLILLFCVAAPSWGQDERAAKAREERKVVIYNTTTVPDMQKISGAFHKKYPFIEVESYRSTGERLIQRILTEVRAGSYLADGYIISGLQMWLLRDGGHVVPYLSPAREGVMKAFKDRAGVWTGVYFNLEVIGYNTNLVSQRELPRKWEDLLDTKWRGRIMLEAEDLLWFASLQQQLGEEKAMDFAKRLAKQQLQIRRGHTLISQLVAAGEAALSPTMRVNTAETLKQKGAPVDWHAIEPIAPNPPVSIGLAKNSPHPNAARLFIDFILSREGQSVIRSLNRNPTRGDVEQPVPRASKIKIFEMNWDKVVKHYSQYEKDFSAIFGGMK